MAEPDPYAEAERLMREAQRAAEEASRGSVPPRGWAAPGGEKAAPTFDLGQITALVESLRGVLPPELAHQLAEALRQLLLALRAVLDWYIARLEGGQPAARDVEDIPVE
jgi:peptidoglycan/xylan/chitin deacetylase (PgdA/CDA1 family)